MIRLTPEQVGVAIAFAERNWDADRDEDGADRLAAAGVPAGVALAAYRECRAAYEDGYRSVSGGGAEVLGEPTDPTLARLWDAGRTAAEAEYRRRRGDRMVGYVVVGVFVLIAAAALLLAQG